MLTVAALHHIAEPADVRQTLVEMVRVARPGGRIVIWDHNPRNPYWGRLMARVPQDTGEERLIPEDEVLGGLRAGGAEILSSDQLGMVPDFTPPRGPARRGGAGARRRAHAARAPPRRAQRRPGYQALAAPRASVAA